MTALFVLNRREVTESVCPGCSIEIAWTRVFFEERTNAGNVLRFFTQVYEGLEMNDSYYWKISKKSFRTNEARLPSISHSPLLA